MNVLLILLSLTAATFDKNAIDPEKIKAAQERLAARQRAAQTRPTSRPTSRPTTRTARPAPKAVVALKTSKDDTAKLQVGWSGRLVDAKVMQVVDEKNVIVTLLNLHPFAYEGGEMDVWVSGVDTSKMIDDAPIWFDNTGPVVRIESTTRSPGTTRTILKATVVDAAAGEVAAPATQAKPTAPPPRSSRRRR